MPRLSAFLAANPELGLNLQSSTHVVDFERESVDMALRLGGGHWPGVTSELLFHEWIAPVASPEFIKRYGKPKGDAGSLAKLPLLTYLQAHPTLTGRLKLELLPQDAAGQPIATKAGAPLDLTLDLQVL